MNAVMDQCVYSASLRDIRDKQQIKIFSSRVSCLNSAGIKNTNQYLLPVPVCTSRYRYRRTIPYLVFVLLNALPPPPPIKIQRSRSRAKLFFYKMTRSGTVQPTPRPAGPPRTNHQCQQVATGLKCNLWAKKIRVTRRSSEQDRRQAIRYQFQPTQAYPAN